MRRAVRRSRARPAGLAIAMTLAAPMLGRAAETAWIAIFPSCSTCRSCPVTCACRRGSRSPSARRCSRAEGVDALHATVDGRGRSAERRDPAQCRWRPTVPAFSSRSSRSTGRSTTASPPGRRRSKELHGDGAVPAARRAHRPALRVSVVRRAGAARRADGGDIYAPAGTRVRLRVHTDKPIASGDRLRARAAASQRPERSAAAGDRVLEARTRCWRATTRTASGSPIATASHSSGDTRILHPLMDDRPPDVRILRPAADQQITPLEEVAIEARADDDYGIAAFDLVYAVGGGAEQVVPFDRVAAPTSRRAGTLTAGGRGSRREARRRHHLLRARPRRRPRQAVDRDAQRHLLPRGEAVQRRVRRGAEPGDGGGAASAQIESLIAAQKEIISATWNIERRSQARAFGRAT